MKNKIISPIAIDMGAKNTGVYLNHFEQGEDPTSSGNTQGKTIVIDSTNITWSQADRTGKRHQIRTNKRRKLSKRLLKLVLNKYNIKANQAQSEYINGLLNNRGYNRIEITEEQAEILQDKIVNDFFSPVIFNNSSDDNFLEKLSNEVIIKDDDSETYWKEILKNNIFSLSGNNNTEFKEYLQNKNHNSDDIKVLSKAFTAIKSIILKQIDNYKTGHLHRRDYLDNIKKDINNSELLKPLLNTGLTAEKLANLIGNISNLQLRVLRKYFNDETMKTGDIWMPEKLHILFFKWVRSWHAKQENEKQNRQELLKLKDKNNNILDIFTTDPKKTIPPYEDQNNRRPPKDLTLRLNPKALDKQLENWENIAQSLADNYILPQIDDNITEQINIQAGLEANVRPQKGESEKRQILVDTLHRILDRTIVLDPYKLRWLAQDSDTPDAKTAKELLNQHSNNNADNIIVFAKKYYSEVEIAKQGLWTEEGSLFFRCETNPPHKNKIQHNLISHILGEKLDKEKLQEFIDNCWNSDNIKIGRSTIVNIAKKAEEERKLYGNRFNYLLNRQLYLKQESRTLDNDKEHGVDGKSILKVYDNCLEATDKVAKHFKHDDERKKIYANVFSFCQLYNILETQIKGFSKTDRWNTIENSWRSSKDEDNIDKKGNLIANASRLTADSIRPFDGLLDRIISRQAIEIARMKIKQIESLNIDKNDKLFVPVFMEQNHFAFEQSLHEIKGLRNIKKKAKDRVAKGLTKQATQWQDKDKRIKKNTICPYTGEKIGKGEIDHIIPQSQSKKRGDVVFNSEANLIYCSGTGNHQKDDNRWSFEQLNHNYLNEVFAGETNIKQAIISFVNGLDENDSISFHNLEDKEQNYLRHALFIRELDGKTFPILNTRYKTFVNGTQGYLGKQIRKLLQEKYPNIEVKTYQINAQEVSQLRTVLGEANGNLKKQERQGAFSHVVDAALVLATALQNTKIADELTTTNVAELSEQGQWLKDLLPNNADVLHIKRKPKYRKKLASTQIFKDGLYGERFMPILLNEKKLYYGFALDNCHEIEPLKEPKKTVKDFDKKLQTAKQKQQTKHNEYFELLKPFLYTGKKNAKKPVTDDLSDNWQYNYLSIDKTKALEHLQKCAKEVCNDIEIRQAQQLEKLRYSIEKKNIKSVLLTDKKAFITQLDDKKFKISGLTLAAKNQWEDLIRYPIKDYNDNRTTLKECFGKPEQVEIDNLTMANFWQNLTQESGLNINYLKDNLLKKNDKGELSKKSGIIPKGVFDNKIKTDERLKTLENNALLKKSFGVEFKVMTDLIPQPSWDKLFKAFFHTDKIKNYSHHKQVRKDYSLPIVSNPSGGFRIKRKNPLTDETVYQVSSVADGGYACGFEKDKSGKINMTKDGVTFHTELKGSTNVAYIGKGRKPNIKKKNNSDLIESFGNTREVNLNIDNIQSSYLTLAESGRIDIKIFIKKQLFKELCQFTDIDVDSPPSDISIAFGKNTETEKYNEFKAFINNQQIPMPRDSGNKNRWVHKLSVQVLESIAELSYRTSLSRDMQTAYQNGTPKNNQHIIT